MACILVQGGLVLNSICFVKLGHFYYCKVNFWYKNFFPWIFLVLVCFKDEVIQLSSWKCLIGIGLVIGFQLQSTTNQNLESFLDTNTLWSFNQRRFVTPNLILIIYNESNIRLRSWELDISLPFTPMTL